MSKRRGSLARGFTVLELLIVLVLASILMLFGLPALFNFIQRSKLEGFARETALLIQAARFNAIKNSGSQSVVKLDLVNGQVISCQDNDLNGKCDATDIELGRYTLPNKISFGGPPDGLPFTGLTLDPAGGSANIAILKADGSIQASGAFRFGDVRQNYLEVQISPQGTARVEVLKWDGTSAYRSQGENGKAWIWNT
jgi:prepilin-type N-terminal cleavage/methylation domain-containing protein